MPQCPHSRVGTHTYAPSPTVLSRAVCVHCGHAKMCTKSKCSAKYLKMRQSVASLRRLQSLVVPLDGISGGEFRDAMRGCGVLIPNPPTLSMSSSSSHEFNPAQDNGQRRGAGSCAGAGGAGSGSGGGGPIYATLLEGLIPEEGGEEAGTSSGGSSSQQRALLESVEAAITANPTVIVRKLHKVRRGDNAADLLMADVTIHPDLNGTLSKALAAGGQELCVLPQYPARIVLGTALRTSRRSVDALKAARAVLQGRALGLDAGGVALVDGWEERKVRPAKYGREPTHAHEGQRREYLERQQATAAQGQQGARLHQQQGHQGQGHQRGQGHQQQQEQQNMGMYDHQQHEQGGRYQGWLEETYPSPTSAVRRPSPSPSPPPGMEYHHQPPQRQHQHHQQQARHQPQQQQQPQPPQQFLQHAHPYNSYDLRKTFSNASARTAETVCTALSTSFSSEGYDFSTYEQRSLGGAHHGHDRGGPHRHRDSGYSLGSASDIDYNSGLSSPERSVGSGNGGGLGQSRRESYRRQESFNHGSDQHQQVPQQQQQEAQLHSHASPPQQQAPQSQPPAPRQTQVQEDDLGIDLTFLDIGDGAGACGGGLSGVVLDDDHDDDDSSGLDTSRGSSASPDASAPAQRQEVGAAAAPLPSGPLQAFSQFGATFEAAVDTFGSGLNDYLGYTSGNNATARPAPVPPPQTRNIASAASAAPGAAGGAGIDFWQQSRLPTKLGRAM